MTNHPNRSKQQQAKHTPGPWRNCEPGSNFHKHRRFIREGNSERLIATISDDIGRQEREANARLIAAAPELLAALKELATATPHVMKANPRFNKAWHEARAAIAKAQGR